MLPANSTGKKERDQRQARVEGTRIAAVPISMRLDEKSVWMPSVMSWSSACTSLVMREISTPVLLRE